MTYIVRVAYSTTFFERERRYLPPEAADEGMPTRERVDQHRLSVTKLMR